MTRAIGLTALALAVAAAAWSGAGWGIERTALDAFEPVLRVAAVVAALGLLERLLRRVSH